MSILITGATNGIGKQAALELAKQGHTLTLTARDVAKGRQVCDEIAVASGNDKIDVLVADLSQLKQVKRFAQEFKAKHTRLDVLINNAGGVFDKRQLTADGYEYTFAFNHLAYFLLTQELLDLLKASAPARIINVSSQAHEGGRINFDDIMGERRYASFAAYSQSKLANVMFTYALARKLDANAVTVNALHPGFVNTGFGDNSSGILRHGIRLAKRLAAISPERGAETVVYLATSPQAAGQTAKYWDKCKSVASNAASQHIADQDKLWTLSEQLCAKALA
jgi:NAD(P)-dependent dehydrogenase (short-subunit alcohol dehydrogenase family)